MLKIVMQVALLAALVVALSNGTDSVSATNLCNVNSGGGCTSNGCHDTGGGCARITTEGSCFCSY
jgi:hypothetical protein